MGIRILGKNIIQIYHHHIMKLNYLDIADIAESATPNRTLRPIDQTAIGEELQQIGTNVTIANLTRLLLKNRSLCEGFIFSVAGRPVGTIWVMYQGANDIEYRIRRIKAYIFDVYINENYRGNGYAGEMICLLMKYLHERGINSSYLAVAKTNKSAIRAYKKVGFESIVDKKFARVLRVNIPYHEL